MQAILIAVALLGTPNFPAAMQQDLDLGAPPRCTVCHATDAGGSGTVVQRFGVYLVSRGLQPFDEGSLRNALLAAAGEHHSSNSNGLTDIDALEAGLDPNGNESAAPGVTDLTPEHGCSSTGAANLLPIVALAAWLFVRSRNTHRYQRIADGPHRGS